MPVYEAFGSTIIHLGQGDVCIGLAHSPNEIRPERQHDDELCFIVHEESHPIGQATDEYDGIPSDQLDCPVRIVFDNTAAIDVMIERLTTLRGKFGPQKYLYGGRHG